VNIKLPDCPDNTAVTIEDDLIVFMTMDHDDFASNPLEDCDAMGRIYSFSRRHGNFLELDAHATGDKDEAVRELADKFGDFVILGYFEHGLCDWHLSGHKPAGTAYDYQWDGCSFAGVWVPDKYLVEEAEGLVGDERTEKMREWAAQACEVYTQYCNGFVYTYSLAAYKVRRSDDGDVYDDVDDYRFTDAEFEDSCYGFYGEDIQRGMREAVDGLNAHLECEKSSEKITV
jgi:hypothetical protein